MRIVIASSSLFAFRRDLSRRDLSKNYFLLYLSWFSDRYDFILRSLFRALSLDQFDMSFALFSPTSGVFWRVLRSWLLLPVRRVT